MREIREDFCCPSCHYSYPDYDEEEGYYSCSRCGEYWAFDSDDHDYDEEPLDLGGCCSCGCTGQTVRNIVMLEKKAPVPGTGWGCVVCGLPSDGAVAVVCDDCLALMDGQTDVITSVVYGYPVEKKRYSITALTEEFKHLNIPH